MLSRFRSSMAALIGGVLILTLAVSGTFGAKGEGLPGNPNGAFGPHVAAWVLGQLDEQQEPEDEPDDEQGKPRDEDLDEDLEDEDDESDESADSEESQQSEESEESQESAVSEKSEDEPELENDEATDNHGACVSAVAGSDAVGGPSNNHGWAVSLAARFTCWGLTGPEGDVAEDEPEDEPDNELGAAQSGPAWLADGRGKPSHAGAKPDTSAESVGPGKGKGGTKAGGPGKGRSGR